MISAQRGQAVSVAVHAQKWEFRVAASLHASYHSAPITLLAGLASRPILNFVRIALYPAKNRFASCLRSNFRKRGEGSRRFALDSLQGLA